MIYPKKNKVRKAASGLNTSEIQTVEDTIKSGIGLIPGIGTAVSAAIGIGSKLGEQVSGDGTSGIKNAVGGILNPMSGLNSIMSGNLEEAIPIAGGFIKARRMQKEKEKLRFREQGKDIREMNEQSNRVFGSLTMEDGGEVPDINISDGSGDAAVILGGRGHDKGGNDIVDTKTGEKLAETESSELVFTKNQSEKIEQLISSFDESSDQEALLQLGSMVKDIVKNNMVDFSGK